MPDTVMPDTDSITAHVTNFVFTTGGSQLADGFAAFTQAAQDATQRLQRGTQPRPLGYPPGSTCFSVWHWLAYCTQMGAQDLALACTLIDVVIAHAHGLIVSYTPQAQRGTRRPACWPTRSAFWNMSRHSTAASLAWCLAASMRCSSRIRLWQRTSSLTRHQYL